MAAYASWRAMQLLLFLMGLAAFLSVVTLLPETIHPGTRGIDILLARELRDGLGAPGTTRRWRFVWLNPFKAIRLLRGPVILFVVSTGALFSLGWTVMLSVLFQSLAAAIALATFFGDCFTTVLVTTNLIQ